MTSQGERSFMNSEAHRLKNRMRQQRYRARKREEKAKRNGETVIPVELFFTGLPCVTNEFPLLRNDTSASNLGASGARNWSRSVEYGHGQTVNFREGCSQSAGEAESFEAKTVGQQPQQQHCEFQFFGTDAEDDADIAPGDHQTYHSHKIVEPLSKMQNEYGVNSLMMQGGYVMNPLDQRQHSIGLNDILARRLKNRERQRRYRARKRLEADMRGTYLLTQSTPLQLESQLEGGRNKYTVRTHCPRDWKEDARTAQASKGQDSACTRLLLPAPNVVSEVQASKGQDSACTRLLLPAPNVVSEVQEKAFLLEETGDGKLRSEQPVSLTLSEVNGVRHGRRDWKAAARNKVD